MKKILLLAVMFVSLTASAQQKVGTFSVIPKAGFNLANLAGDVEGNSMKLGLVAGADVMYQVTPIIAVSGGAFYSMQGAKGDGDGVDTKLNFDYINVPILANYYIIPGLAIKAGIQPGFNVKHKIKVEANGYSEEGDMSHFKSFDLSIPLGLSYEFSDFVIDARYNLGLTKLVDHGDANSKNSVIQFTVGYKIPF